MQSYDGRHERPRSLGAVSRISHSDAPVPYLGGVIVRTIGGVDTYSTHIVESGFMMDLCCQVLPGLV